MSKADEALKSVQQSNEAFKLKKEPEKYLKEGNYARADYFEAKCKELEIENAFLKKEIERLMPPANISDEEFDKDGIVEKFNIK